MRVLNATFIKATNPGGRLYDGIDAAQAHKNGDIGFLLEYAGEAEGLPKDQKQVRKFEAPTQFAQGQSNFGRMPVIIMQPEMMYDKIGRASCRERV